MATLALAALPMATAGQVTTRVSNTATLSWGPAQARAHAASNTVSLDVARAKLPTRLSFRVLPTGFALDGLGCLTDPQEIGVGAPLDVDQLAAAPRLAAFDLAEPIVMVLEDATSNHDAHVRDIAYVRADGGGTHHLIQLTETGPDTGVFAGGFPPGGQASFASPCDLHLHRGDTLVLSVPEDEDSLGSTASQLVDPAGFVFSSTDGALVDGATVTLLDASGAPARVYGDDGTTVYPSTVVTGAGVSDASGHAYPAITGRYRFPLVDPGSYTLRVVPPAAYRAPSTASPDALARLRGPGGMAYAVDGGSFARPFVVTGDRDVMVDVPVDPADPATLLLTKTASVREASVGDVVQYRLTLANRGTARADDVRVHDTLPPGLRYQRGSARGAAEPDVSGDGRTLDFALPALVGGAAADLSYVVTVAPGAPAGEALNRARASAGGVESNEAAASVRLRALLFTDALTIAGRVSLGECDRPEPGRPGVAGIRLLLEDGTWAVTDRDGLYHIEGARAGRHVVQVDEASIPAGLAPAPCEQDTRHAGHAAMRFVEGQGGLLLRADFQLRRVAVAAPTVAAPQDDEAAAAGNRDWLAGQAPGIGWLFPDADHNPRAPALRVVVKHRPGQRVALTVNGQRSEPLAFDGTDASATGDVAVSRWTGIPLVPGDNRLQARVLEADGRVAATLERTVHLAGAPRRAELLPGRSRLVADGLTRPLVAVRLTDKDGRPVRAGTIVPVAVDAPYAAAVDAALDQGRGLAGRTRAGATARVAGDDGVAMVALEPTTQGGALRLTVSMREGDSERHDELRAWLAASRRQWAVVGFGAGTIGFDTLSRHAASVPGPRRAEPVLDGQLALYAKGRIKGEWLLTMTYDSQRAYDPDRGLLGTIDPDRYYTVYGDGSYQAYDAPTRRKLYLRLERRQAYLLFGDFESGLTDARFTRYSRTLNGVKAAYEGRAIRAAGFAASSDQRYARDEIGGNGLSGPYRLSQRGIVPNSDKLRIEVRDRFRSERIVSTTQLTRHLDYDIDTELGTVRFRQPVLSRDPALNPTVIVAEYEVESGYTDQLAAAGHASMRLLHGAAELGAGAIRDDAAAASVVGLDARVRLGAATLLRGEVAAGGHGGLGAGTAYLVEVEHRGGALDVLGYARQQASTFGVGQQNVVEAGTRKLGVDASWRLLDRLTLTGTAWRQDGLDTGTSRTAAEARLDWRRAGGTLFAGAQVAADRGLDGGANRIGRTSALLALGGSREALGGRLVLTGQTQVAPGGHKASVDFPARHQLSASWRLAPGIRLIGGYEIADGRDYTVHTAQMGIDVAPWRGAKIASSLDRQGTGAENAQRLFAQYGLSQSLPIGRHWIVDGTLDATQPLGGALPAGAAVSAFQPAASAGSLTGSGLGTGDTGAGYVAVTLGASYRAARWSWTGRIEHRDGADGTRWGLTASLLRTLGEGRTLAGAVRAYTLADAAGAGATSATADLALAIRPPGSRWSLLERFQLRHDGADAGFAAGNVLGVPTFAAGGQVTSRAVNDVALDWRTGAFGGHGLEVSIYYGIKYVRGRFADDVYTGFVDVTGFSIRRDLSPRLDLGLQGSVQHAWAAGVAAFSGGPSLGVSPGGGAWITMGYNVTGYRDRDFEASRYTRAGPYLTLRLAVDRQAIADAAHALWGRR